MPKSYQKYQYYKEYKITLPAFILLTGYVATQLLALIVYTTNANKGYETERTELLSLADLMYRSQLSYFCYPFFCDMKSNCQLDYISGLINQLPFSLSATLNDPSHKGMFINPTPYANFLLMTTILPVITKIFFVTKGIEKRNRAMLFDVKNNFSCARENTTSGLKKVLEDGQPPVWVILGALMNFALYLLIFATDFAKLSGARGALSHYCDNLGFHYTPSHKVLADYLNNRLVTMQNPYTDSPFNIEMNTTSGAAFYSMLALAIFLLEMLATFAAFYVGWPEKEPLVKNSPPINDLSDQDSIGLGSIEIDLDEIIEDSRPKISLSSIV